MAETSERTVLRDWALPTRILLSAFLLSVGLGYLSAMVQLHFQVASAGEPLPTPDDAVLAYHGASSKSQLERLLTADVSRPFNGSGTMRPAFTTRSAGWGTPAGNGGDAPHGVAHARANNAGKNLMQIVLEAEEVHPLIASANLTKDEILQKVKDRDARKHFNGDHALGSMRHAFFTRSGGWKTTLRMDDEKMRTSLAGREGERLVLLDWVNKGMPKAPYEDDKYLLIGELAKMPITKEYTVEEDGKRFALVGTILMERCVRCHSPNAGGTASRFPLEEYDQLLVYADKGEAKNAPPKEGDKDRLPRLLAERDGERLALIAWVREKAPREPYEQDHFLLKDELAKHPITEEFVDVGKDGQRYAKIGSILEARCVRCHGPDVGGSAGQYPLTTYEQVKAYTSPETSGGMSLEKLAQTTHVHLLGFSMLYGMTGLIFSFTSFPLWMRLLLSPWPLLWQVIDISCWWLARTDPIYAKAIVVTGGLVGMGLMAQVVLSLFNMYSMKGKLVVLLLLIVGVAGIGGLKVKVFDPHLEREKADSSVAVAK